MQHHEKLEDTCCTQILKEEGLEKLFQHFEDCVHGQAMNTFTSNNQFSSKVVVEEIGSKMRRNYKKWSKNFNEFNWGKTKPNPPTHCIEDECMHIGDERFLLDNEEIVKSSENDVYYGCGTSQEKTFLKITPNFCLSRIFNIIWLVPEKLPGLHYSYIYFGTPHAFFPVHVEDALLLSLNYLHIGHPKIWIVIPPWATALLDYHLARSGFFLDHTKCRNLLGHKCLLPTVYWLRNKRIPFKIVVQRPGDMVVLYPSTAHFEFNLGHNIAEAINIATESWIPWAINALKCTCFPDFNIHLKVGPLVAAFRPDLLTCVLTGQHVVTPQIVQGIKLLADELSRLVTQPEEFSLTQICPKVTTSSAGMDTMLVCPALTCNMIFNRTNDSKKKMTRHVKRSHAPIESKLLTIIEEMFS